MLPDSAPAIAVLASGAGSNFEALVHAATQGSLRARIVVLVSDQAGAGVLDRAVRLGIESAVLPVGRFKTRIEDERPWVDHLRARGVQLIALAGFMRRLHDTMLQAFPDRILNLHPSLLPSFPGLDAIGRAWRHGVQVTGCTVHVVRDEIDGGPIVGQQSVEVRPNDTLVDLERRIHEAEHRLFPHCIDRYLHEPWRLDGRRLIFGRHADHPGSRAASGHA